MVICAITASVWYGLKGKPIPRKENCPDDSDATETPDYMKMPPEPCAPLSCGHSACNLADDHCREPEHRMCMLCKANEERDSWEQTSERLMKERDEYKEAMGQVMDRLKGPEAGLAEDLEKVFRQKVEKIISADD